MNGKASAQNKKEKNGDLSLKLECLGSRINRGLKKDFYDFEVVEKYQIPESSSVEKTKRKPKNEKKREKKEHNYPEMRYLLSLFISLAPVSFAFMTAHIRKVTCSNNEPVVLKQAVADLFKLYFDELFELGCDLGFQGFQSEWTDLPGKYDFEKRGGLFVAIEKSSSLESDSEIEKEKVIGCIAIRPLNENCGEVKRMFIRKSHRRAGVGKLLAETIINHAWEMGYDEIKLDSLERLSAAVNLYENMGFQRIDPYCECPEEDHVCMALYKN